MPATAMSALALTNRVTAGAGKTVTDAAGAEIRAKRTSGGQVVVDLAEYDPAFPGKGKLVQAWSYCADAATTVTTV
jgi:hypothetical protein